jgi:hypothetical protein
LPNSWAHSINPKPATKRDAAPSVSIVLASPPHLANATRKRGQSLGSAFATLTAQDFDRASDMVSAMETGLRNAQRKDDYERSIMNDEAALISMGFWGRSEEDW